MGNTRPHFLDEALNFVLAELGKYKMFFEGFLDLAVIRGPDGNLFVTLDVVAVLIDLITDQQRVLSPPFLIHFFLTNATFTSDDLEGIDLPFTSTVSTSISLLSSSKAFLAALH